MRTVVDMRHPPALSFFPTGPEEEIIQSIYCIVATTRGSVPCYREYGIASEWLHRPINAAQAAYAVSLVQAIRAYEPRVKVERVTFDVDILNPDHLCPVLEVTILE